VRYNQLIAVLSIPLLFSAVTMAQGEGSPRPAAPATRGSRAEVKNLLTGDPAAIRSGQDAYNARCAMCHGSEAKGTRSGADLTWLWTAGGSDQQLFQSVRRGLSNTLLPHSFGPDDTVWEILAYLRSLESGAHRPINDGSRESGQRIFDGQCRSCHRVNGEGGHLGPDLSVVGANRLRPLLEHKIRQASAYIMNTYAGGAITDGYEPVTLVTASGQEVHGAKKNEDAFSIQIMDTNERLQGYRKSELKKLENGTQSLMPDFGADRISDRDLNDLLSYLCSLTGSKPGSR
jgi:putative heme-binding domain-containing protein